MANSFELITKYLPKAVDKYFYEDAKTAILEQGNKFIDVNFQEAGYVKIASFLLDGLADYVPTQESANGDGNYAAYAGNIASGERDGFAIGGTSVQWEILKLQYKRGRQFRIDYISDEETAGIVIGNAIEEFNRTKVIPEVDATRFSIIAGAANASLGNKVTETPSASDIITKFNTAFEWLSEHEVPEEDQVIFVNPAIMTFIRNSSELTKFITQGDYKSPAGLDFTVEKYAGRPIIVVPTNRFFDNVTTTGNGYKPVAGSKVINYLIVSTKAVTPIRKVEWNKIYGPEQAGLVGFYGYLIDYLLYHGTIIPKNKVPGVYVSLSSTAANTKVNTLAVATAEGASQYYWKLAQLWSNPAGLRYAYVTISATDIYTIGSGLNAGDEVSSAASVTGSKWMKVAEGVDVVEAAGSKKYYFALVDYFGNVVAKTGQISVTQHA